MSHEITMAAARLSLALGFGWILLCVPRYMNLKSGDKTSALVYLLECFPMSLCDRLIVGTYVQVPEQVFYAVYRCCYCGNVASYHVIRCIMGGKPS